MKIEKINENQIRCTLTREDLASRDLKISELAYGSEKAKSLFREMMQQANFEFGFEAEDIPLMIEAIPLNSDSIVLIITKVEDPEELDTRFSRFAPSVTENINEENNETISDVIQDFIQKKQENNDSLSPSNPATDSGNDKGRFLLFHIDSIQNLMNAAALTAPNYNGHSALYKDQKDGTYLLSLARGEDSPESFQQVCNILSEYGTPHACSPARVIFIRNHNEILIKDHAIQSLGKTNRPVAD